MKDAIYRWSNEGQQFTIEKKMDGEWEVLNRHRNSNHIDGRRFCESIITDDVERNRKVTFYYDADARQIAGFDLQ